MHISGISIENFRLFGAGDKAFQLSLKPGLTAFVGENDAGKTALVDALRFVLGTRDQESLRLELTDFHQAPSGARAREIVIRLIFSGLTGADRSAFAEYLTYRDGATSETNFILTWVARRAETDGPVPSTNPRAASVGQVITTGILGVFSALIPFSSRALRLSSYRSRQRHESEQKVSRVMRHAPRFLLCARGASACPKVGRPHKESPTTGSCRESSTA